MEAEKKKYYYPMKNKKYEIVEWLMAGLNISKIEEKFGKIEPKELEKLKQEAFTKRMSISKKQVFGHKSEPYYKTEDEMIILPYLACDLEGEELNIFNKLK